MNYYIQGNKEKADQIKAAFEARGCVMHTGIQCDLSDMIYFSLNGKVGGIKLRNLDLFKTHPDYKELELPIEPKFKVGDWVVCWNRTYQILDNKSTYIVREINGLETRYEHSTVDENGRLWTIQGARDGDVVTTGFFVFIFRSIDYTNGVHYYCHCGTNGEEFDIALPESKMGIAGCENIYFHPATQKERDLLFDKMKEAGYQWDSEKKELRKIKPHYDISNFKPYQKVLIRFGNNDTWRADFFSHIKEDRGRYFVGIGYANKQCIPFEGNEKLLGTTDMCPEEYINW